MCGIAGMSGRVDPDLLARMGAILAHRGPDDDGAWSDPSAGVGLAHRRLSIIDLSPRGHQPLWDAARRAALVYNGEIYNYRDLRAGLERDGFAFAGDSDTEVLLNLYLRDGAECLGQLNGIFAFALWDAAEGRLLLARDGMGVKPLYTATAPDRFLFASEIKALLVDRSVPRGLDPVAVRQILRYLWCPAPRTPLAAVRKVLPGEALWVRDGRVEARWRFADLPFTTPRTDLDARSAAAELRKHLETAVTRQLVADVPVGAFLSGGLDSSVLAALATRAGADRLPCFSIRLGQDADWEGFAADLPYAERMAAHLGVPLEAVDADPAIADELPRMLYHLDEPQADLAPLHVYRICRLARERGVKVLLSGAGADDLFAGYRRHVALGWERAWGWLPAPARCLLRTLGTQAGTGSAARRRLERAFRFADRSADERLCGYFHWLPAPWEHRLAGPALRAADAPAGFSPPLETTLRELPDGLAPLQRMLALEVRHFLGDHNLPYTDKLSMATGVEVRVPFLDPDVAAFAGRLPPALCFGPDGGKQVLKDAARDLLPAEVIARPKTGFGVPLRDWLRGPLRPLADDVLSDPALRARGLFDPEALAELRRQDAAGAVDGAYPILACLMVELWCRIFVDPETPTP